jgi:hypothetical protein
VTVERVLEARAPSAAAGTDHRLDATAGDVRQGWAIGAEFEPRRMRIDVPARSTLPVTFRTDAPPADLPLDGRTLVLMFLPEVRAQEVACDAAVVP